MKTFIKPGIRVMITRGHLERDTLQFVGTMGTIYAVYSNDPIRKDRNNYVVAVKLDSRLRHDEPMTFRASDLADCQVNRKVKK